MREKKINEGFGKRFTEVVEKSGYKSINLIKQAEISKNSISEYKKGQVPSAETLCKLSQLLGTTCEYLLMGKEPEDLTPEERLLVDTFRNTSPEGKTQIQQYANERASLYPANNIEHPEGVSTSSVG